MRHGSLLLRAAELWRQTAAVSAFALVSSVGALVAATPAQAAAVGGYELNGSPDGLAPSAVDPSDASKELGPDNGVDQQLSRIHLHAPTAASPTLAFTNVQTNADLKHVWFSTNEVAGQDYLYFAWERIGTGGTATFAYEFQQDPRPAACDYSLVHDAVEPATGGEQTLIDTCNPFRHRTVGDFLVVFGVQGGSVQGVEIRRWDGAAFETGIPAPAGSWAMSADKTFGEAVINLSATVFNAAGAGCLTYGNVVPGTVTGNSDTASWMDVVLTDTGAFDLNSCSSLTPTISGTGDHGRTVTWSLTKSATPNVLAGAVGADVGPATWSVTATKSVVETFTNASGPIKVENPNPVAATSVEVTATLGGVALTTTCPANATIPANGTLDCTWSAAPASAVTDLRVSVATSTAGMSGATNAPGTMTWTVATTGSDTATLADADIDVDEQISASATRTGPQSFPCTTAGTRTERNTATLTPTGGVAIPATATVDVTCTAVVVPPPPPAPALTLAGSGAGAFDRVTSWTLDKTVDERARSGDAGGSTDPSHWTVRAVKAVDDQAHRVGGTTTVSNPASVARQVAVTAVLSDGTDIDVDCPAASVAAGGQMTCDLVGDVDDDAGTSVTVTVASPGLADVGATFPIAWTAEPSGDDQARLTDERIGLDRTLTATDAYTVPERFSCPSAVSAYPADGGPLVRTEVNEATLVGTATKLSDTAEVVVTCEPPRVLADNPTPTAGPTPAPRTLPFVDSPGQLPRTGGWLLVPLAAGSAMLLVGSLLVGSARARRQEP